jgi:predicted metal-binding protein
MPDKQHTLFVCTSCASVWQDGKQVGESGGQRLLKQLQHFAQDWELQNKFLIQKVECMSACNRSCVIAFTGEEKLTYLFGDLPVDGSASAVLQCASQYYAKCDGSLLWSERPEPLKNGILAKIPPLNKWAKLNISCCQLLNNDSIKTI